MTQASQRHKLETGDMADTTIVASGALTFTLSGDFIGGVLLTFYIGGDSTDLVAEYRVPATTTATAVATAAASVIDGLTGVTASALSGVITIGVEAPNTAVTADKATIAND